MGRIRIKEAKFMFENGFDCGFSIGGWVVKRDKTDRRIISEFKLDEVSVLTMQPANQLSWLMVKSIQQENELTQDKFWNTIIKAYDAEFSDDIKKSLEQFLTLNKKEPILITPKVEPSNVIKNIFELYI